LGCSAWLLVAVVRNIKRSAQNPSTPLPMASTATSSRNPQGRGMVCDTHASNPVRALNIIISQK
jgi:hypothetical protein